MKNVENVSPVHQTRRKSLEAGVESLLQQDIIEPAVGPTP